ncbi:MAG: DUF480 domain-containing protein [Planctomycetota bacterium]|nr:MAG: DUF480 domain-containing protein [Planctomycetota bacterium]
MKENPQLDALEARVLGVLIEKELTTPEQYPLSLNALVVGCSQKSNRHPVMEVGESDALSACERLRLMQLAGLVKEAGARVERWRHNARETLDLLTPELAVLAELLMRGAQQPGELRTRASRMAPIESLEKLEEILAALEKRGYARRLPPPPGSRAVLIAPALTEGPPQIAAAAAAGAAPHAAAGANAGASPRPGLDARVAALEAEVAALRAELAQLRESLGS